MGEKLEKVNDQVPVVKRESGLKGTGEKSTGLGGPSLCDKCTNFSRARECMYKKNP